MDRTIFDLILSKNWKEINSYIDSKPDCCRTIDNSTGRMPLHKLLLLDCPYSLINFTLNKFPDALYHTDNDGNLPIHYSVKKGKAEEVFATLIKKDPSTITLANKLGELPLHYALVQKLRSDRVLQLIKLYPEAVKKKTKSGKLPIHAALEYNSSLEVIQTILEEHPNGCRDSFEGKFLLHFAAEYKSSVEVCELLVATFPKAVELQDSEGRMPIHVAAINKCSAAVISLLIERLPSSLMHRDKHGRLPLHYGLEKNASPEVVLELIKASPEAASVRGFGVVNLPLSTAVHRYFPFPVIEALLHCYPPAAKEKDMVGSLPLRNAFKNKLDSNTVISILNAFPEAATEIDEHRRLALHYAASRNMPLHLITALIQAYPKGACCCDKNGQLPLHLAVIRLSDLGLIQMLIDVYKNGLRARDKYDNIPLNYAIENDAPVEIFNVLLADSEDTASIWNKTKLPIHQAIEFKRPTVVLEKLLNSYPDGVKQVEKEHGRLPIHWAIERELSLESLHLLESRFHDGAAFVEDYLGRLPIHYAIDCKAPALIAKLLLETNPDIITQKNHPIHCATILCSLSFDGVPDDETLKANADSFQPRLLLHYAIEDAKTTPGIVAEIMMYTMPISYSTGNLNLAHYFTWTYVVATTHDKYWEAVEIVLGRYDQINNDANNNGYVRALSEITNEKHQKAVDIATERCRHAILRRMYYHARYELLPGPIVHKSVNSLVRLAVDHDGNKATVALKFMKNKQQFYREIRIRRDYDFSSEFVLPLRNYHDGDEDLSYREEAIAKGFGEYPYCVIFYAAERDLLNIMLHEHITGGRNPDITRDYCRMVLQAVQHLHGHGLAHGDIKRKLLIWLSLFPVLHCSLF